MNGAVAAISMVNGKVLDVAALSRYCQGCVNINALENTLSYDEIVSSISTFSIMVHCVLYIYGQHNDTLCPLYLRSA